MIVDEEFLSKLRRAFSLNLYEVKLWTALLSRGVSTAGELSDMADVPRSRTYDVLESLERKGFVVVRPEKPIKYMAISPHEVLDRVQKRVKELADSRTEMLSKLHDSEILGELKTLYDQGIEPMEITDFSSALKGRHNLYDHLGLLIKESESSINIMTTVDGVVRKIRGLKPLLEKAYSRGVKIRILSQMNDEAREVVDKVKDLAEVRESKDIQARFCVVDNKQILFMLLDDKEIHPTYDLGMWVNTPFFAGALNRLFEMAWEKGTVIIGAPAPAVIPKEV